MTTLAVPPTAAPTQSAAPSMGRLTAVELRKMADTRAGRWLLIAVALIAAGLVTIRIFAGDRDTRTLESFFSYALTGVSLLVPVLGILAVTSEWSQRTALTTFALVPKRARVLTAKLLAALAIGVLATAAALLFAVLGNLISAGLGRGSGWDVGVADVGYALVYEALNMLMGVAFGALFLTSGLAIVVYFVLPIAWTILGQSISGLHHVDGWLDLNTTSNALLTGSMTGGDWARVAVSAAVWVALPLVVGAYRVVKQEVK